MAVKARNSKYEARNEIPFGFRVSCFVLPRERGFALLIAVIFMSVMLSLGLALSSIGYKQAILASSAIESQYAFYAADAAMECALYADQQQNRFAYSDYDALIQSTSMACDGIIVSFSQVQSTSQGQLVSTSHQISLDNNKHCADVTIYKYSSPQGADNVTTRIFSQGYDVPCATVATPGGARFVSRGLNSHY